MKQSTVNITVILGVVIMALGAWTMPMYTAGLNRAAFEDLGNEISETQNQVSNLESDVSGGGLEGGLDLVSLQATTSNEDDLQKALGSNFNSFSNKFIKKDSSASQFDTIEVKTFEPTKSRFKFPNDLVGMPINEQNGGGVDTPATSTCTTNGTPFDSANDGGAAAPLSATEPSLINGFALLAPDYAANGDKIIEIQICMSPGSGTVIIDELIQLSDLHAFTKNFDYGIIPPNQNLRVLIHDTANAGETYRVWIFRSNPIVQPIRIINDVGGGLGNLGTQCTSITVNVKDGSAGAGANINGARVQLNHSFMPLTSSKFSSGAGQAVFNNVDFGGVMPPGLYFVEVTPPPANAAAVPFRAQVDCKTGNLTPVVTARLATLAEFSASVGGGNVAGALTVNIKDQSGAPLTNTFVRINAQFAPIVNLVCDGVGNVCINPETGANAGDTIAVGTLTDAAADGTFQLTNLPLPGATGGYGVGACKVVAGVPKCTFQPVNLTTAATTVNLSIFIPV